MMKTRSGLRLDNEGSPAASGSEGPMDDTTPLPLDPPPLVPTPVGVRIPPVASPTADVVASGITSPLASPPRIPTPTGCSQVREPPHPRMDTKEEGCGLHGAQPSGVNPPSEPCFENASDTLSLPGYGETRWRPGKDNTETRIGNMITQTIRDLATVLQPNVGRPSLIPRFTGSECECPRKFLEDITSYCANNNIPREEWTNTAANQLRGDAARWYDSYESLKLSFREFEARLMATYDGLDVRGKLFAKLYGQRQDRENASVFLTKKRALMRRMLPHADTPTIVSQLKTMLRPEIRIHLRSAAIDDVDKLIQIAADIEGDLEENQRSSRTTANPQRSNPPPRDSGTPRYPCRHCGGGHYDRNCPQRTVPPRRAIEEAPGPGNFGRAAPPQTQARPQNN